MMADDAINNHGPGPIDPASALKAGTETETEPNEETISQMEVKVEPLRTAILKSRPPYCAGTLTPSPEDLVVFHGKDDPEISGRIDFSNASDRELERLSNACDKATFGRGTEDVLDESYRKAGKLDATYFSVKIDPERSGLLNVVRYNLLDGKASRKPIKAELYKLNVYGKDSFFKTHKDTPRGTTMFGSLVIVLPTRHEGGAMMLRHGSREWTFDYAKEIGNTKNIGYIAFFSDVEHEITPVESGFRVTITYNLYYGEESVFQTFNLTKALPMNECDVKNALRALLEDESFYPDGVHLGFGLSHEYPIELKPKDINSLDFIAANLKGSDALLMNACESFGLEARLHLCYTHEDYNRQYEIIVPKVVRFDGQHFDEDGSYSFPQFLKDRGGKLVNFKATYQSYYEDEKVDFKVLWVTEKASFNEQKSTYMAYGNEYQMEHAYGKFCLIVKIGPAGNRASMESTGISSV